MIHNEFFHNIAATIRAPVDVKLNNSQANQAQHLIFSFSLRSSSVRLKTFCASYSRFHCSIFILDTTSGEAYGARMVNGDAGYMDGIKRSKCWVCGAEESALPRGALFGKHGAAPQILLTVEVCDDCVQTNSLDDEAAGKLMKNVNEILH